MKAVITTANKATLQEDGSEFLDIEFQIFNDADEVIETKRRGYPLDTPGEEIQADVAAFVTTYEADLANAEANKERDALHAKADQTIEALVGAEVAPSNI